MKKIIYLALAALIINSCQFNKNENRKNNATVKSSIDNHIEKNSTTNSKEETKTGSAISDSSTKNEINIIKLHTFEEFEEKINLSTGSKAVLKDAPKGMALFPNGTLTWTPANSQIGNFTVTVEIVKNNRSIKSRKLYFQVLDSGKSYDGVFIDLSGKKGGDGSDQNPYGTFKEACENLNGMHNIYLRGGIYKNPGYRKDYSKKGRYPAIGAECQGTQTAPITLRPWGNEYVKIKTDARYGIKIKPGAKYITVQNLEIEGEAQNITLNEALKYWWQESNDTMQSTGIAANGNYIVIRDNIIHNMPGSGISITGGAYATIKGNIVYNCDWWTIAGSKGIGITQATDDSENPANGAYKNIISENFIFNVEQRVFSHVWAKGFATLTIDEGEAILIQEGKQQNGSASTNYTGRYLIKNNLIIYNGKSSVVNLAKNTDIINNSYYNNGGATKQAGFRISKSDNVLIAKNAVEANIPNTIIYSVANSNVSLENNYAKGTISKNGSKEGIIETKKLFIDPANLNFDLSNNIPKDIGISKTALNAIKEKIKLYSIKVAREHLSIDKAAQTKYIIEHAPGKIDCSHYNDSKNPYIRIYDINNTHPLKVKYGYSEFKLYIKHKYGECIEN